MAILKVKKLEIEIQEQTMHKPGSKYFVLIKSENENQNILRIFSSNKKPVIKHSEDNGIIVIDKTIK
mgnify:CR=1 FL=1|tara:strand:- start:403 stop:603 length:201 start_codon:yes stop_codon:yes gene_type:complete